MLVFVSIRDVRLGIFDEERTPDVLDIFATRDVVPNFVLVGDISCLSVVGDRGVKGAIEVDGLILFNFDVVVGFELIERKDELLGLVPTIVVIVDGRAEVCDTGGELNVLLMPGFSRVLGFDPDENKYVLVGRTFEVLILVFVLTFEPVGLG